MEEAEEGAWAVGHVPVLGGPAAGLQAVLEPALLEAALRSAPHPGRELPRAAPVVALRADGAERKRQGLNAAGHVGLREPEVRLEKAAHKLADVRGLQVRVATCAPLEGLPEFWLWKVPQSGADPVRVIPRACQLRCAAARDVNLQRQRPAASSSPHQLLAELEGHPSAEGVAEDHERLSAEQVQAEAVQHVACKLNQGGSVGQRLA
mmetsp:Transcript_9729/g.30271  ORF Transcript_9729/g.30271 Transcript_9729/m.30271 type:complete len:207 (+) Transcript_9729:215-835(+)